MKRKDLQKQILTEILLFKVLQTRYTLVICDCSTRYYIRITVYTNVYQDLTAELHIFDITAKFSFLN